MTSTKSQSKHPTGYVAIRSAKDIQKALARRINRILMDRNEDHHGGQLAALCNAWVNAGRFDFEINEVRELKVRIELIEQVQAFDSPSEAKDFKKNIKELQKMIKVIDIETSS